MNRLHKELHKRGVEYEADDMMIMKGAEYDCCEKLVDIVGDFIITAYYSAVLPTELRIYDKHYNPIGGQGLEKDYLGFCGNKVNPFGTYVYGGDEV